LLVFIVDVIFFGSVFLIGSGTVFLLLVERLRVLVCRSIGSGIIFLLSVKPFRGGTSTDFEVLARLTTGSIGLVVTSGIVRFRADRLIGATTSGTGCLR